MIQGILLNVVTEKREFPQQLWQMWREGMVISISESGSDSEDLTPFAKGSVTTSNETNRCLLK